MRDSRAPLRHAVQGVTLGGFVGLVALVGGGLAVGPLGHQDITAMLTVDGQTRSLHTSGRDVRAVLTAAGVTVGAHDVVAPAPATRLRNGSHIVVVHARPLTLAVNGDFRTVWVTQPTVGAAIRAIGLRLDGAYVSASRSGRIPLTGTTVLVRMPQTVTLRVGRSTRTVVTTAVSVGDLLAEQGVRLNPLDRLSVSRSVYPTTGLRVAVHRVTRRVGRVITRLPFATVRVTDASLLRGDTDVRRAGRAGRLVQWYAVTRTDGRVTGKRLVKTGRMRPVSRVVAYGTKTPPPPPPPPPVHHTVRSSPASSPPHSSSGLDWAALAHCESGGDPSIVDPPYYGLYQFALGTWRSVGGSGLPSDASVSEQTYRAQLLYNREGRAPWPVCGKYL